MRGLYDLESVYDETLFLPLTFYFSAPYSSPEGNARASWYGFNGTPSVMFDGQQAHIGGAPNGSMYESYLPTYQSNSAVTSPVIMIPRLTKFANPHRA